MGAFMVFVLVKNTLQAQIFMEILNGRAFGNIDIWTYELLIRDSTLLLILFNISFSIGVFWEHYPDRH